METVEFGLLWWHTKGQGRPGRLTWRVSWWAGGCSRSWASRDRGRRGAPAHETARSFRGQSKSDQELDSKKKKEIIHLCIIQSKNEWHTSAGQWAACAPAARKWCRCWPGGSSWSRKPEAAESETESQTPSSCRNKTKVMITGQNRTRRRKELSWRKGAVLESFRDATTRRRRLPVCASQSWSGLPAE